jgi:O-antigen ligase
MGLGTIAKTIGPLGLYGSGIVCSLLAFTGNVRFAMLLMVFLLPLRNIIDRLQSLPLGNQFIDILLFGTIVGWFINSATKGRPLFEKSSINIIAGVLIIYTFISTMLGGAYLHGHMSFDLSDTRIQDWKNFALLPVLFYVSLNNTLQKKDVWLIVGTMCFALLLIDYYTINQIRWYSALESRAKINGTFRFLGPNEVAAFFNTSTLVLLGIFYSLKKNKYKWPLFGLILINIFCVTFTYSRAAYAGLMAGLFILFAFKDKKMLIGLLLVVCLWQTVLPEKVVERIKETKKTGQLDESSQRRLDIWEQSLNLFASNPVTGIGFGVFRFLNLDLKDTHNIYVKLLTEQGAIGLLIFMIVIFCFIREGWKLYRKGETEEDRGLGIGFIACIAAVLVNNIFGDRWSYLEPNAYLWIFAGLVSRLNVIAREPRPVLGSEIIKEIPPVEPLHVRIKKKMENQGTPVPLSQGIKKKVRYYDL